MFPYDREREGFCPEANGDHDVRISLDVDEADGGNNCKKGVTPLLLELFLVGFPPPLPGICFDLAGKVLTKVLLPLYHYHSYLYQETAFQKDDTQQCQFEHEELLMMYVSGGIERKGEEGCDEVGSDEC